jgi:CPA1 family monovalent cation:H+ antiporter
VTRGLADIEYFKRETLGWREGTAVVWAGMRGAVTVAAAQTLPEDTPHRSQLVLVAFAVAGLSLLLQGGTIGPLLGLITPKAPADDQEMDAETMRIGELMRTGIEAIPKPRVPEDAPRPVQFEVMRKYRLEVLTAQRSALLDARDHGTFDADVLADALATLDADQIAIEMRGRV